MTTTVRRPLQPEQWIAFLAVTIVAAGILLLSGCSNPLASQRLNVVAFVSPSCKPCLLDKPALMQIAYSGYVTVDAVNVDENKQLAKQYGVTVLPTYIVLTEDWQEIFRTHQVEMLRRYLVRVYG
jgi:thiol-disulfide isomerase/thioredoxin